MTMDRGAAHAAIVLILNTPRKRYFYSDIADDILDAIWPDQAGIWEEGYNQGLSEPDWQTGTGETPNPYQSDAAQTP